ncbi:hypothetical protein A9G00_33800 [Achromobacter xylosoxidans]|nr:hypothetical protein A9G00_33800 [Achromobacter xylosoxidans]
MRPSAHVVCTAYRRTIVVSAQIVRHSTSLSQASPTELRLSVFHQKLWRLVHHLIMNHVLIDVELLCNVFHILAQWLPD